MAEKLLEKAYKTVISLEPITPDASPSKKDPYLAKVHAYAKWIEMMQSHVAEVLTASGVDGDISESAGSKPQKTLVSVGQAAFTSRSLPFRQPASLLG